LLDVVIAGGMVLDGAGNPWFRADVGIVGDRIACIGNLDFAQAPVMIRAAGKVLDGKSDIPTRLWIAPPTKMDAMILNEEGYYAILGKSGAAGGYSDGSAFLR